MVWSISITNEGWDLIGKALEEKTCNWLIKALVADSMEKAELVAMPKNPNHSKAQRLDNLSARYRQAYFIQGCREYYGTDKDMLVDACLRLMEENDTCENGGFEYWIDKEGYFTVIIED
jgi:hypothetical protein